MTATFFTSSSNKPACYSKTPDQRPKQVIADLGFRGVDADNPAVEIIHRGKYKSLTKPQRRWLKRRQAVEPAIGHLKSDHRMDRCWLQGQLGDACTRCYVRQRYNLRWLMRAIRRGSQECFIALCVASADQQLLRKKTLY